MQLLCEFLCEYAVELGREVSQCVPDGKYLLFFSEDVLALRSMVDILVIWFFSGNSAGMPSSICF